MRAASTVAIVVAVAHFVNDGYASLLAPLLPRLMGKLDLSVALAAVLATSLTLASSVLQPLMGYLSDRYGNRLFIVMGPLLSGIFLSLIGLAPTFAILVGLLALGGLGSAVFHPPGASLAARVSEGKGSGMRLSIFVFGGMMGFAVGPLVAVAMVARVGLEGLWMAMFPGILVAALLLVILPRGNGDGPAVPPPNPVRVLAHLRGPLGLLFGISAMSAFVQRLFLAMDPIAVAHQGGSEALGGVILSVYLSGQAVGTLTGGYLSDRVDRRRLLVSLTLLALPAHMMAVWLPPGSAVGFVFTGLAGILNMAILPPVVVWAQEMLPEGKAVSSGIVMGLAWAVGSTGVLGSGLLGDIVGARASMLFSFPIMLLATFLALHPRLAEASRATPASAV
jgi:FSR family fosmidomycin resistance protein-like MFS transporter